MDNGSPLTPSIARRLIPAILAGGPLKREEIARQVVARHLAEGGTSGQQPPQLTVKKALGYLREDGKVEPGDGFALWQLRRTAREDSQTLESNEISAVDDTDSEGTEQDTTVPAPASGPSKILGDGPECVYIYYHPNDEELARLKNRDVWECKIGMTESPDPTARVAAQGGRTARSRPPIIALILRTDDASALEKALHASLRLLDAQVDNSEGNEWFLISPSRIKAWYFAFKGALDALTGNSGAPG